MKRFIPLFAIVAAITMAFTSKPKEWTMLQCFYTSGERDSKMVQAVSAMIFGGYEVTDYLAVERNGYYCYEISFLQPV